MAITVDATGGATPQAKTELKQTTTNVAPVEGIPPETQTEEPKKDLMSKNFAALARQAKEFRKIQEEFKAEREAFAREREAMAQEKAKYSTLEQKIKNRQFGDLMQDYNFTYDDVTQSMVNQPTTPEQVRIRQLEQKIEELSGNYKKVETSQAEAQTRAYEQAKKQITADVRSLVTSDPSSYEAIQQFEAHEAVTQLIEQEFQKSGVIMGTEEAAREVEEYLLEQAKKIATLKKLQAQNTPPVEAEQKQAPTQQKQSTTLSNRTTSTPQGPLTAKQRRERAIAAFLGQQPT